MSDLEVAHSSLPERYGHDSHKERFIYTLGEHDSPPSQDPNPPPSKRASISLWPLALVALLTAVVVGAVVGGALGSQLKDARNRANSW
jgi:hypothetical protein